MLKLLGLKAIIQFTKVRMRVVNVKAKIHLVLKITKLFLIIFKFWEDLERANFLWRFTTQLMMIAQNSNELFSFWSKDLSMNKFHLPYSKQFIQIDYGSAIHIL